MDKISLEHFGSEVQKILDDDIDKVCGNLVRLFDSLSCSDKELKDHAFIIISKLSLKLFCQVSISFKPER